MVPAIPNYVYGQSYDKEHDILLDTANDGEKEEYENLHNGYDWFLFYKEEHPEMEIPYKLWNGEIVDISARTDGGPGSGNFGHAGRPGQVGGSAKENGSTGGSESKKRPSKLRGPSENKANVAIGEALQDGNLTKNQKIEKIRTTLDGLHTQSTISLQKDGFSIKYLKRPDGNWTFSFYRAEGNTGRWLKHGYVDSSVAAEEFFDKSKNAKVSKAAETYDILKLKPQAPTIDSPWKKDTKVSLTTAVSQDIAAESIKDLPEGMQLFDAETGKAYKKGLLSNEVVDEEGNKHDISELQKAQVRGDYFDLEIRAKTGVDAAQVQKCRQTLQKLPAKMKAKYESTFRNTRFKKDVGNSYDPTEGVVAMKPDSEETSIWHEVSHAADRDAITKTYPDGTTVKGASAIMEHELTDEMRKKDMEAMLSSIKFATDASGNLEKNDAQALVFWGWYRKNMTEKEDKEGRTYVKDAGLISDIVSGMTNDVHGGSNYFGGHPENYWKRPSYMFGASAQQTEYWAEYCQCRILKNKRVLKAMKNITPNRYALAEKIYKEAFG